MQDESPKIACTFPRMCDFFARNEILLSKIGLKTIFFLCISKKSCTFAAESKKNRLKRLCTVLTNSLSLRAHSAVFGTICVHCCAQNNDTIFKI